MVKANVFKFGIVAKTFGAKRIRRSYQTRLEVSNTLLSISSSYEDEKER